MGKIEAPIVADIVVICVILFFPYIALCVYVK